MSTSKNKGVYLPKERTNYHPHDYKSGNSPMPNPAVDAIVANNIATSEFDYTESLDNEQ